MTEVPTQIMCVDCGGTCHLLTYLPEGEEVPVGSALAYRCEDCHDRWDVVWEPEE